MRLDAMQISAIEAQHTINRDTLTGHGLGCISGLPEGEEYG
jgi:hypothetical protein